MCAVSRVRDSLSRSSLFKVLADGAGTRRDLQASTGLNSLARFGEKMRNMETTSWFRPRPWPWLLQKVCVFLNSSIAPWTGHRVVWNDFHPHGKPGNPVLEGWSGCPQHVGIACAYDRRTIPVKERWFPCPHISPSTSPGATLHVDTLQGGDQSGPQHRPTPLPRSMCLGLGSLSDIATVSQTIADSGTSRLQATVQIV